MVDKETLRYYVMLRDVNHPVGVREAQRLLGFKSPGKSQRVLNRLVKLGLAVKTPEGKYVISRDPPFELIGKMIIKGRLVPKITVLGVYTTSLALSYILLAKPPFEIVVVLLLLVIPIWIEGLMEYLELKRKWETVTSSA